MRQQNGRGCLLAHAQKVKRMAHIVNTGQRSVGSSTCAFSLALSASVSASTSFCSAGLVGCTRLKLDAATASGQRCACCIRPLVHSRGRLSRRCSRSYSCSRIRGRIRCEWRIRFVTAHVERERHHPFLKGDERDGRGRGRATHRAILKIVITISIGIGIAMVMGAVTAVADFTIKDAVVSVRVIRISAAMILSAMMLATLRARRRQRR
jgi:hypothetical protein